MKKSKSGGWHQRTVGTHTRDTLKTQPSLQRNANKGSYFLHQIISLDKTAAAAAKSLQSCPTLCDPIDGSPAGSPRPWDSPGKNTGVGCHFLPQCLKVKSESEVT